MNLLVVEDNPRDMQELLNLLHGWEEQNQPLGIRAESCITADTMQAFQGYDAVLLDIETPGIDGMAFARRLRACNSRIDIIFVTCHTDLVMDGFSVHAAGFLPKPVEQKQLWETLDFLAKRSISRRADACVTFKRGTACDRYYYDDILYIEARHHNIVVVTPQTRQKYNLSLTQALENLPQPPFVRCHRSYIVNTTKVTAVEKDALLLAGGGKAPTTPTYSTAIQRALLALKA